jgi:predicted ArsR family transcriptional regulator
LIDQLHSTMAKKTTMAVPASGLLGEARGRLLTELCGKTLTAAELAIAVGTSANAVRVHLDGLRSAGLVDYRVMRRGVGKPTHGYSLTASAQYLLSTAYAPVLSALLETLRSRMNGGLRPLLTEAGQRLGKSTAAVENDEASAEAGISLLQALGSPAAIERNENQRILRAGCCPLGSVTTRHRELCALMEGALSAVIGSPVVERCERSEQPRCAFILSES